MEQTHSYLRVYLGMNDFNFPQTRESEKRKYLKQFGVHLFYAEGSKTEPKYVENMREVIKSRYRMSASEMIIIDSNSGGRSTISLIKYVEKDIQVRLKKNEKIDHVWIFYDKDSFKKDDFDNAYNKITSKNSPNISMMTTILVIRIMLDGMHYGQMNVLNYGYCYTFLIAIQHWIEVDIYL